MSDEGRANFPDVAWPDVIGLRTVLAHHYHRTDPDQVWTVANQTVPYPCGHTAVWRLRPTERPAEPGQERSSSSGRQGSPCASATGSRVTVPSTTLTPLAKAGSSRTAARQPRSAISRVYGRVALAKA